VAALATLLLLAVTSPGGVEAQDARAGLGWRQDHPDCIDGTRLAPAVSRILGRDVGARSTNVGVRGRVGGAPGAFRAHIEVRTPDGRLLGVRDVASPSESCRALDEPLAIVVAMLFELEAPRATLSLPPRPVEVERPRAELSVATGASIGAGFLPSPWVAPALRLALDAAPLRVEIGGAWILPREVEVQGSSAALQLSAVLVGAHVCVELARLGWLVPRGCAGLRAAVVSASGRGFDADHRHLLVAPAFTLALDTAVRLGPRVSVELRAELAGHPAPEQFVYTSGTGRTVLHETGLVSGSAGLFLRYGAPIP
jgi:hypothetical protein